MGKTEIANHWIQTAERDWRSVSLLYEGKQFVHELFLCHLMIEKILKACWVKDNGENSPPRIHDLEYLYNDTDLALTPDQIDLKFG